MPFRLLHLMFVLWVPKTCATWAYGLRRASVQCPLWRLVAGLHVGGRAMISGLWACS